MAATKEAILAKEHEPGLDVTIFFLDLRAFGKDFDRYYERAQNQLGVRYLRSFISRTYEMPGTQNLRLVYASPEMKQIEEEFDMIVLSLGLEPSATLQEQAERMGVVLNRWGFAQTERASPAGHVPAGRVRRRRVPGAQGHPRHGDAGQRGGGPGHGPAGPGPRHARADQDLSAATRHHATSRRGSACSSAIAAATSPRWSTSSGWSSGRASCRTWSSPRTTPTPAPTTRQKHIKEQIAEHRLNRVVVASCTPRTHEPIFRDTLRDAGLNPYLLEMANIRDQCSWVHSGRAGKGDGQGDRPGAHGGGPRVAAACRWKRTPCR